MGGGAVKGFQEVMGGSTVALVVVGLTSLSSLSLSWFMSSSSPEDSYTSS